MGRVDLFGRVLCGWTGGRTRPSVGRCAFFGTSGGRLAVGQQGVAQLTDRVVELVDCCLRSGDEEVGRSL